MSTRSTIIFVGATGYDGLGAKAVRLYQHCDGYPTNILPTLVNVLRTVRKKSKSHASRGFRPVPVFDFNLCPISAGLLAGCYIGEEVSGYGMGANIEESVHLENEFSQWSDETLEEVFGFQVDLEWIYVVNSIDRTIKVFGGGYTGSLPSVTVAKGTVNPLKYVEKMVEEYRENEGNVIQSALRSLSRLGFPVNPERKSARRRAIEAQRNKR